MEQPYDPSLKTLAELSPADWLPLAGRRRRRVTVENSDIGTIVSGAADKLFRVHDKPEYLLHLDFESGHFRSELPLRLRLYNSVFEYRHQRVVLSVPVLLCPEADSPKWDGLLQRGLPGEAAVSTLRYDVVRVWKLPVDQLLAGGVGTLALAPISDVTEAEVRGVIRRMRERLGGQDLPPRAKDVMAAAFVLLGLRYSKETAKLLFEEVLGMEESTTYQEIVRRGRELGRKEGREEGRTEEARKILLRQGEKKFGPPDAAVWAAIESIVDLARLEDLTDRLLSVDSWQELLPPQGQPRRSRRRRPEG
jgi:predicted transposase YdaD